MNQSEKCFSKISQNDEIIKQILLLKLQQYQKVIVAVSGGIDSIVLMNAVAKVAHNNKNIQCHIATIDHNIRKNSAQEAQFVLKQAQKLNLHASILKNQQTIINKNIQEKAREIRYKLLYQHAINIGAQSIITAHNAEDNIETFLIRLRKGSGIKGLTAIKKISHIANVKILRPFNFIKRQQIQCWASKNKLQFINDPSNQNQKFERTNVRKIWAELTKQGWNTDVTNKTIQKIQNAYELITHIAQKQKAKCCKENPLGFVEIEPQVIQKLHSQIAVEIISQAIHKVNAKNDKYHNTNSQTKINLLDKIKNSPNFPKTNIEQADIQYLNGKLLVSRQNNRNIPTKLLLKKDKDNFFDNKFICRIISNKVNTEKRQIYIFYPTKKFIRIISKNIPKNDKIYRKLLPVIPVIKNINKNRKQRHHPKFADRYYIPHNQQTNSRYIKFVRIDIAKEQILKQKPIIKVEFKDIHQFQQFDW